MLLRIIWFSLAVLFGQNAIAQSFKQKLLDHSTNVESVTFSLDGRLMASGSWDGNINLYGFDSIGNPVLKQTFKGHLSAVTTLSFSDNGKYLVSGSKDYSSRVWNIDTPSKHKVFNLHLEPVTSTFLDPGNKFLISASLDGTIRTTSINDALKSKTLKLSGPVNDLRLSKDKKFYLAAVKGNVIRKYETGGKNNEVLVFTGHTDEVNAIDISPDGNYMASASSDKSIIIWDMMSGKAVKTLIGFDWKVTSVKFSSDGKYILGGCNNGVTKLFETETGKSIRDYNDMGKNVRDVAISRDGKLIIIASILDGTQFGLLIYNSGITTDALPARGNGKPGKTAPKGAAVTNTKKSNGSK